MVGLERGDFRNTNPDFLTPLVHDELAYAVRNKLFQNPTRDALSFRNNVRETALPIRQFGVVLTGRWSSAARACIGTASPGASSRTSSSFAATASQNTAPRCSARIAPRKIGASRIADLEADYDRFEYLCGISGKAGNLNGKKIAGGNVFEGPRKRDYPNPPLKHSYSQEMFRTAMTEHGSAPVRFALGQ